MEIIIGNEDKRNYSNMKMKARVLLENSRGEIVVSSYGGIYLLPGGSIDDGENPNTAILREIKEELGITNIKNISNIKQIIQWPKENNFIITEYVFIVEINKNQKITLSKEHTNYKWCNFKEAYQTLEKENNKNTLKLMNKELIN